MAKILHIGSSADFNIYNSILSPLGHTIINKSTHNGSLAGYDLLILSTFNTNNDIESTIDLALFSQGIPVLIGFDNSGVEINTRWLYKKNLVTANSRGSDLTGVTINHDIFNEIFGTIYEADKGEAERTAAHFMDRYTFNTSYNPKIFMRNTTVLNVGAFWNAGTIIGGTETIAPLCHMGWLMFSSYQPTQWGKDLLVHVVTRLLKKYKVNGTVFQKESGQRVPNVTVSAISRSSGILLGRDISDQNGDYEIMVNDATAVTLIASNPNQSNLNAFSDNVLPVGV